LIGTGPARDAESLGCGLFLRFMMGKSHSRDKRCPQGRMRRWHEGHQGKNKFRIVERWQICARCAARYGKPAPYRCGSKPSQKQQEEMPMSKAGLCAIVTGSASGLGAATAAILAKGGGRIVVNYSNSKAEAEATADLCRSAGAEVVVVQGDVSRDEDCKKIAAAAASWGRLDVLVNNYFTNIQVPHNYLDVFRCFFL
jgi:hypothetical protein